MYISIYMGKRNCLGVKIQRVLVMTMNLINHHDAGIN